MVAASERYYMSPQDYLEWEEQQPVKYEYFEGKVVAMTGGTVAHGTIAANLFYQLKSHLRGTACRPFIFDIKLGISQQGPFHYPDVMVTCDPQDKQAQTVIYYPCLIIEVLSPSTEGFDRGKKFRNYRQISTLQEYVLVSSDQINIECFRLNENGLWELHAYTEDNDLELNSINFNCAIALIYEDVMLNNSSN